MIYRIIDSHCALGYSESISEQDPNEWNSY